MLWKPLFLAVLSIEFQCFDLCELQIPFLCFFSRKSRIKNIFLFKFNLNFPFSVTETSLKDGVSGQFFIKMQIFIGGSQEDELHDSLMEFKQCFQIKVKIFY
jgi:hypothetical protein